MTKFRIIFYSTNRADYTYLKKIIIKLSKNHEIFIIFSYENKLEYINLKKEQKIKCFWIKESYFNSKNLIKLNKKIKPNFNFIVGDRKEMVLPTIISKNLNIKILHLGGGEQTLNSPDENYRNVISLMSNYHFCSTKLAKKRLNQLGINKNIKIVGPTSYEELSNYDPSDEKKIYQEYNIELKKIILFCYHSENYDFDKEIKLIDFTINQLLKFGLKIIITSSNKDFNGDRLNNYFKKINNNKIFFIETIGSKYFKYFLRNCLFMIGNSSSGIIEAGYFKKINISIGLRQIGRDHDTNSIFVKYDQSKIKNVLNKIRAGDFINKNIDSLYKRYNSTDIINKTIRLM